MQLQAGFGISDRLYELAKNLSEMEKARVNGESEFELSAKVSYITPLAILPLAVHANHYNLNINCAEDSNNEACEYLDIINFQRGSTNIPSGRKSFLPITNLRPEKDDNILLAYEEGILSWANIQSASYKDIIRYFTRELVENVKEHARIGHYWILAQYYPASSNKTCEIIIADNGRGYKKSYEDTEFEVETDSEAIQNAYEGKSSKSARWGEPNERGQGIPSIARLFLEGLGGKLVIISGNSIHYYKQKAVKKIELNYWKGAVVCINFNTMMSVNIYDYL